MDILEEYFIDDDQSDIIATEIEEEIKEEDSYIDIILKENDLNLNENFKNYINNQIFRDELIAYQELKESCIKDSKPEPAVPNSIGVAIIKICENLSRRYNFHRYTYRDIMISHAIEHCIKAVKSFDVNKKIYYLVNEVDSEFITATRCDIEGNNIFKKNIKHDGNKPKRFKIENFYSDFLDINDQDISKIEIEQIYRNIKQKISPLSYFTRTAWNAFVQVINSEKIEQDKKVALVGDIFTETLITQEVDNAESFISEIRESFYGVYSDH